MIGPAGIVAAGQAFAARAEARLGPPGRGRRATRGRDGPVAWEQLSPWVELRATLPVGAVFCVLRGPARGRPAHGRGPPSQLAGALRTSDGSPTCGSFVPGPLAIAKVAASIAIP